MKVRKFIKEYMCRPAVFTQQYRRVERPNWNRREGDRRIYVMTWDAFEVKPTTGWVTGLRYLQTGYVDPPFYEDPASFVETGPRKLCVLVTTWPTRNPAKVPLEALEVTETIGEVSAWSDEERRLVALQCKDWPRDEWGRFAPEPMVDNATAEKWSSFAKEQKTTREPD